MTYLTTLMYSMVSLSLLNANSVVGSPETTEMVRIKAGTFVMGNSEEDDVDIKDAPQREVALGAFFIGKHEVTKSKWDEVWASAAANGYTDLATGEGKDLNHPVQKVSWYDVVKWCNLRSELEGLVPCYRVGGVVMKTGQDIPGQGNLTVDWTANGYRLPTEAEWEKAARGGKSNYRFTWGDRISFAYANYTSSNLPYDDSGQTPMPHPDYDMLPRPFTSPVGDFEPNNYGLYDMAGNVSEWCWDIYDKNTYLDATSSIPVKNPRGPISGDSGRVYRGGAWSDTAFYCRSANRVYALYPSDKFNYIGFRLARSVDIKPIITQVTISPSPVLGKMVKFSVVASGANLRYQWYKKNSQIHGATGSEYVISSLKKSDGGFYKVKVWNTAGGETSDSVMLDAVPKITSDLADVTKKKDQRYRYAVKTNFDANSFSASNLPPGLKINSTTGVISGMIKEIGDYTAKLIAEKKVNKKLIYLVEDTKRFIVK